MYIDILKLLNENSIYDDENIAIIEARSFHKLAEELNDLFALRSVVKSVKEKEEMTFEKWLKLFKNKDDTYMFEKDTAYAKDIMLKIYNNIKHQL